MFPGRCVRFDRAILLTLLAEGKGESVMNVRIARIVPQCKLAVLDGGIELSDAALAVTKAEVRQASQFFPNVFQVCPLLRPVPVMNPMT